MATDEVVANVFGGVIEQLRQQARKGSYKTNPVLWAKDVLGIDPWSKQIDILEAVQANDHVAVRSCHGSGKSYIASILACWWVAVHPEGEAIVVTTAPTYHQVHSILWEDIRKHHINAAQRFKDGLSPMRLPGSITQSDMWKSDSGTVMGFGRKPADNNDHGFQGIHRRYVLVIIDESCGIRENLFTAVEAITTTENSRILAIGNPDDPATHFNKFFTKSDEEVWARIDVSSFDSPNFTKNHAGHYNGCDDPECLAREWAKRWDRDKNTPVDTLPLLPNEEWVEQRRKAWGEDSPLWLSKVLGKFPLQSVNTLFSRDTLNRGIDTDVQPMRSSSVILGVDLARFGPDYSTIYKYEYGPTNKKDEKGDKTGKYTGKDGGQLRLVDFWGGKADEQGVDGMESAARVHQWAQSLGADEVRIDAEGVGGPILDQIVRLSDGAYTVIAMKGSAASPDKMRWKNARAYWYDSLRERMFNNEIDIDAEDKKLEDELEQIQYFFEPRFHALQIESKEDMAKRGIKSPDFSDAAVYAAADMSAIVGNPLARFAPGDRISMDVADFLGLAGESGMISPL
jgi:hypothetical protein